jgi:hypothetical protein
MAILVDGQLGVGDGWFLVLDEPYAGSEDEDGVLSFTQELRAILPQTISWDHTSTTLTPEELLAGTVDDVRNDTDSTLTDLGPISGQGWIGHLFRDTLDPAHEEYELLAPMYAQGRMLNLAVRYIGPGEEAAARRVVANVIHDPRFRDQRRPSFRPARKFWRRSR